ncbi:MAG: hypothetical protein ACRDEA_06900 [Microcystaceae cyanobacterium]
MTKKRLSDLLREEAQKVPESEATATDSTEPEEANPSAKTPATSNRSRKTIKELTTELEAAREHANSLQEKVTELESELAKQKTLIKKLQTQSEQTEQLQATLEEQKILVSKLYAELQQVEAAKSQIEVQKQQIEKLSAELEKAQQEPLLQEEPEPVESLKLALKNNSSNKLALRLSGRFIASEQSSTRLSNEDIGWFD